MKQERDKFLTEAMGECWHEVVKHDGESGTSTKYAWCPKCEMRILTTDYYPPHAIAVQDINFSGWEGFGKLWEWAQKQEWWNRFIAIKLLKNSCCDMIETYIHPDRFADAVYQLLSGKG